MTEIKENNSRINPCQVLYSYRDRYKNINTEIVDQKILFRRDRTEDE